MLHQTVSCRNDSMQSLDGFHLGICSFGKCKRRDKRCPIEKLIETLLCDLLSIHSIDLVINVHVLLSFVLCHSSLSLSLQIEYSEIAAAAIKRGTCNKILLKVLHPLNLANFFSAFCSLEPLKEFNQISFVAHRTQTIQLWKFMKMCFVAFASVCVRWFSLLFNQPWQNAYISF